MEVICIIVDYEPNFPNIDKPIFIKQYEERLNQKLNNDGILYGDDTWNMWLDLVYWNDWLPFNSITIE